MTKKDFEAIAAQMLKARPRFTGDVIHDKGIGRQNEGQRIQWTNDVCYVADALAASNPRFDRDRFYRACGVEVK